MHEWSGKIDDVLGEVEIPSEIKPKESEPPEVVKRGRISKKVPTLVKKLTGKEKFSLESASILQFCDGKLSVEEICKETNIPKVKVNQILAELQKKRWIKFKRVLS